MVKRRKSKRKARCHHVKGHTRKVKGKRVRVKGYRRC